MLAKIDSNQDKQINCDEFIHFMRKLDFDLRKSEASCIMKYLDYKSTTILKIVEFKERLKAIGYSDPYYTNYYEYIWQDKSFVNFFRKFKILHKFRSFLELFNYFDGNSDGILTSQELLSAVALVHKKNAERIVNITIVNAKNNLNCIELAEQFKAIERKILAVKKISPNNAAMEICIKSFNSLVEINHFTNDLVKYSSKLIMTSKTGLEIHARKYRLSQGINSVSLILLEFRELVDYLLSFGLKLLNAKTIAKFIENKSFEKENIEIQNITVPEFQSSDAQIEWESDADIRYGEGVLNDSISVLAFSYSHNILQKQKNGEDFYGSMKNELAVNVYLQEKYENIVKCLGHYSEEIYSQKSLTTLYEKIEGNSIKYLIENSGGILTVPIIHSIKGSTILFAYWGKQILSILDLLQSYNVIPLNFSSENIYLDNNGSRFYLRLQGIGLFSEYNTIISPDIKIFYEDYINNPFIAPEFFTNNEQTSAINT